MTFSTLNLFEQKCHSLNSLTKESFLWRFALQGCLLYRDMNSHSMAAIKINPETLEQEGTITMPGTNTPLMCYWSLRAGQINGLTCTLFFSVLTCFLLKQDVSKGLSLFHWIANSLLYAIYIAIDIWTVIWNCKTFKFSLFKFHSLFLRSTSRCTEHCIHRWRIYQPDCSLQRCKLFYSLLMLLCFKT